MTETSKQDITDKYSWWNHEKNKEFYNFPISVIKEGDFWVATFNDETIKLWGDKLNGCGQGKTKEKAIEKLFLMVRISHDYSEECRCNYQRFVPFRKGDWKHIGGKWFTIFGINVFFRYGKNMKHGWYIPLTKLNISIHNQWKQYKKYRNE